MYTIYADDVLIYDSTLEDYKIVKGLITLETNKSGSFVFAIYPDHFYYDKFVRLKTIITVYKADKIVFRGRILNDTTDYFNKKELTCEGELGFLQDSIIRPFEFNGTPEDLFKKFIDEHNAQVDESKRFKLGSVTVEDPNNYIARSNSEYDSAFANMSSRLIDDSLGGYFYITHGENGTDEIPTIHYLAEFSKVSTQTVEFGENLKDYTKKVKANDIATAIIPLGAETDDLKLTIANVNDGKDYVYSEAGVALYGWIFKPVEWRDVTDANNLKAKAEAYLESLVNQNITIELKVIDLHLIDPTIESIEVCTYVRVISEPHNFDSVLLCNKQTIDLLKPSNDSLILGYTYSTFSEKSGKLNASLNKVVNVQSSINQLNNKVITLDSEIKKTEETTKEEINVVYGDLTALSQAVNQNAKDIDTLEESIKNLPGGSGGGVGIEDIEQTVTSTEDSGINVITVTLTDNTTRTFEVRNGSKGSAGDGSGGGGFFSFESDEGGNLYVCYDEGDTPPTFEVDESNNIYYVFGEV